MSNTTNHVKPGVKLEVTVHIPDSIGERLGKDAESIPQWLLEKAGLEAYKSGEISGYELRLMLGIPVSARVRCLSEDAWGLSRVYRRRFCPRCRNESAAQARAIGMSVIISNTAPIDYLVLIDHIVVLHHLYAPIIIPQAVFGELHEEGTPAKVKAWVAAHPPWLEVRTVTASPDAALALLDVGEREVIRLAQEVEADALIMDEPAGREAAKRQGLRVLGTLRVLYDAAALVACAITISPAR